MSFKDGATVCGGCIGIIVLILTIITATSYIMDYDSRTSIENNTTIELNGVLITVPISNNYSINNNSTLSNINDTMKFGYNESKEIVTGNAYNYYDYVNQISIYVCDKNRTAYSDIPDFSTLESFEGDSNRTHIEKRTIDNKIVYMYVNEGKGLSKLIIDSAKLA